ncbi:MAG: hypothetical protein ACREJG_05305 [Candidatus Rokuibacteriota bacterium]
MSRLCAVLVACMLGLALPPAASGQAPREHFQLKIGPSYDEGDFGTSDTTRTFFLPLTLKYLGDRFDVGVTMSYVSIDSAGGVTIVDGRPVETGEERGARRTDSGFGDIFLRGRYFLIDDPGPQSPLPALSPTLVLKIPTADEDDSLGTGEPDFGFGLELDKTFGNLIVFGEVSYRIIGDPPGQDFRNRPAAYVGAGLRLSDLVTVIGLVDWRRALIAENDDPLELVGVVSLRLTPTILVSPNAFVGLTDGSPDFGIGVELSYKFGRY